MAHSQPIDYVTPGRFFCLLWWLYSIHYYERSGDVIHLNTLIQPHSKTEFIIISLSAQIKKIPDPSIHLSDNSSSTTFTSDAPVRNLGVTFDPHLSFSNHLL